MQDLKTSKWPNQDLNSDLLGSLSMSSSQRGAAFQYVYFLLSCCVADLQIIFGIKEAVECSPSEHLLFHSLLWTQWNEKLRSVCNQLSHGLTAVLLSHLQYQEGAGTVGSLSLLLFGHVFDNAKWPKAWALGHQDWDRFLEWWLSFLSWCPHWGRIFGTVIKSTDFNSWLKSFLCHLNILVPWITFFI